MSRSQQGKWVTFSSADGVIADDYTVHMALMARDSSCWFFTNNFLSRRL